MKFLVFMAFCAFLTQSHVISIISDSNTDRELKFTEDNHNSSKNGYGYEQPEVQFNYPNEQSYTHTNYEGFETNNYLDHQSAESKLESVTEFPKRLLLKIHKLYAGKICKHQRDLRIIVDERDHRRPPPRRLVPYTEVVTYSF